MTIKELEEKTGLARANIRYYEQQGLVHPVRRENGYRDYSQQDLQALGKIKLLRHLGLSIETIRTVQAGELALSAALAEREEELSRESAMLAREKLVCGELRRRQVDYDALEPEGYLVQLEAEETAAGNASTVPRPEKKDLIQTVGHPWRRYFARYFDMSVYSTVWAIVYLGIFRIGDAGIGVRFFEWLVSLLFMVLLEPLFLSRFGTTPGKAIFGLRISALSGEKLTYSEAAHWTRGVIYSGMGLNLPFVNLWCNWKSYRRCSAGEAEPWEEDANYSIRDTKGWRIVLFLVAESLLIGLITFLSLRAMAPPHCGALSKDEYIDNMNYIAELVDYDMRMDETGQWQVQLYENGSLSWSDGARATPEILLNEDGFVTGVTLSFSAQEEEILSDLLLQVAMTYDVLITYDTGIWGVRYLPLVGKYDAEDIDLSRSGSVAYGPVLIEWEVDRQGFEVWDEIWLVEVQEEKDSHYTCTVTLTLTE